MLCWVLLVIIDNDKKEQCNIRCGFTGPETDRKGPSVFFK